MKQTLHPFKSLILQIGILLSIVVLCFVFSDWYAQCFAASGFPLLQTIRCWVLNLIPFSWGDIVYVVFFLVCIRVFFVFFRKRQWREKQVWALVVLKFIRFNLFVGLLLYLLWSSLYAQPKLSTQLTLHHPETVTTEMLSQYDDTLIGRLNILVDKIDSIPFSKLNEMTSLEYRKFDSSFDLKVKSSLFGNSLAYFGIEGYFNPLTGEAQINKKLPSFMLPFVVAHEMAHQTGIAAEDDANLMAYIRCVQSDNVSLQYSAYFNIWLYTHRKVHKLDSVRADLLKQKLNPKSLAQVAILKQRNQQYKTFLDDWSSYVFDAFLKLGNQSEGIESYRSVAYAALLWEQKQQMVLQNGKD